MRKDLPEQRRQHAKPVHVDPKAAQAKIPTTPLPKKQLVGIFIINLVLGLQINVVWPFLPFMTDWVRGTAEQSATYVGILTSSYFWAQFVSSFVWSNLASKIGMRRCLMLGLVGVGISFIAFGFAKQFYQAMIARTAAGLLNGNVPILKAYLGTITDSTNQAKGMSVLALAWGLGSCVGPLMGGFLAEPSVVYPEYFDIDGVFGRFPYLLACSTITSMCIIALLAALVLLPPDEITFDAIRNGEQHIQLDRNHDRRYDDAGDEEEQASLLEDGDASGGDNPKLCKSEDGVDDEKKYADKDSGQLLTWSDICCDRTTQAACMSYVFTALIFIIYDEMFPVFGKTPVQRGGLGFTAEEIGTALSVGGFVLIIYQTFFYPKLVARIGLISSYRMGTVLTAILAFVFPFCHLLARSASLRPLLWIVLMLLSTWRMVASSNTFVGSMIIVNNSVDRRNLNRVNAVCQAMSSLSRAVLPMMAGALWSALLRQPWPIQPHGLYMCMLLLAIFMMCNAWRLDSRLGRTFADRERP